MKQSIVATILAATLLVSMVGMASAATDIDVDPLTQVINVNESGTYTIDVNTTYYDPDQGTQHTISFNTLDSNLLATMVGASNDTTCVDTGNMSMSGFADWYAMSAGPHTFTYTVYPQSGITTGEEYDMVLQDGNTEFVYPAVAIPSANVTPEFATFALVGIGLIGLVALGRRRT